MLNAQINNHYWEQKSLYLKGYESDQWSHRDHVYFLIADDFLHWWDWFELTEVGLSCSETCLRPSENWFAVNVNHHSSTLSWFWPPESVCYSLTLWFIVEVQYLWLFQYSSYNTTYRVNPYAVCHMMPYWPLKFWHFDRSINIKFNLCHLTNTRDYCCKWHLSFYLDTGIRCNVFRKNLI